MKGIHCALQGRLGQDVELRTSAAGKDWCRLSVGGIEGDELTWVSVAVFDEKARALAGLTKGAEVYVEGRLTMNAWTGKDRQPRTGLSVSAWRVEVLGRIGKNRPAKAPTPEELMIRSRSETEGWLRHTLKGCDSIDGKRLKGLASDSGIKERTLYRASEAIGVVTLSGGFGKPRRWHLCPMPAKGCHVCLTKTNGKQAKGGRHGELRAVAKAESTESKLKEARGTAELATHPAVNAAMVIKEFSDHFGDLSVAALAEQAGVV